MSENDSRHQKNTEADRAKAEEMRKINMERVSQTKRRKSDEGENERGNKRRSGGDTIEYLKEKNKIMQEFREKELEVRKAELTEQAKKTLRASSKPNEGHDYTDAATTATGSKHASHDVSIADSSHLGCAQQSC